MISFQKQKNSINFGVFIGLRTVAFKTGMAQEVSLDELNASSYVPLLVICIVLLIGLVYFYISNRKNRERVSRLVEKNQELEEVLSERTAQLEATNKEFEVFSHSVSHDLRSPLRSIMAFSEILLNDHGDQMNDEGRLYQQRMRANAERLDKFIGGILNYSKLNRQPLTLEMVDVAALTDQVVGELGGNLDEREVKFTLGELPAVQADRTLLRVVLANLISNAIKFTAVRDTAEIVIGFSEDTGEAVYFVQDNGIGLDMKFSETIFQVFQRLHGVDQYEGTGIGLALVQRIISRHGGRVWVESEEGNGARFCFTIGT